MASRGKVNRRVELTMVGGLAIGETHPLAGQLRAKGVRYLARNAYFLSFIIRRNACLPGYL
jgi:hypothetical protein